MARDVQLSQTLAVDAKVQRLRRDGVDIVDFGAGQPDFLTPEWICEAGVEAIHNGRTRYTPPQGTDTLREVLAGTMGQVAGRHYRPEEILVAGGAKQALFMAMAAVVDPGDEVLIPAPCWVTYPELVRVLGAIPKYIPSGYDERYRLSPDRLRSHASSRSRCLILNTPNNPTGAVYSRDELEDLAPVIVEKDLWLLTDEIYESITYDGIAHVSPVAVHDSLKQRTAVVSGVSKAFAMTGWRIGWMMAPEEWVRSATALQSHITGNPCSISQEATVAALKGSLSETRHRTEIFQERRDVALSNLEAVPGCRCFKPQGTFYLLVDLRSFLGRTVKGRTFDSSFDLVDYLLDEARVAVVPGEPFEAPGHVRISFATDSENVSRGTARMAEVLGALA
jgi:aspartate aminotransferase